MDKKQSRLRRSLQTRHKIADLRVDRLTVYRSNQHIYASIIAADGQKVLASASTVETEVRNQLAGQSGGGGNAATDVQKIQRNTLVGQDMTGRSCQGGQRCSRIHPAPLCHIHAHSDIGPHAGKKNLQPRQTRHHQGASGHQMGRHQRIFRNTPQRCDIARANILSHSRIHQTPKIRQDRGNRHHASLIKPYQKTSLSG